MPEIKISVTNKIATNMALGQVIVCGNSDYHITFSFDAEWDAEPKRVARFSYIRDGRTHHKDVPFEGSSVAVPTLSNVRQVTVGVYAGDLRTTTPAAVLCRLSALCGDSVEEITPAEKAGLQRQITDHDNRLDALEQGDTGGKQKPLVLYGVLDNEYPQQYLDDPAYGDEALAAILSSRQILVRTPNAEMLVESNAYIFHNNRHTALFSPVLTYHLPNYENEYLYLFYLRDEKQTLDLSALGMGSIQIPVYGQLKMKLSTKYMECPLEHKTPYEYGQIITGLG